VAQTYTTPSHDNVDLVAEGKPVDAVNAEFYSRFQYPWPPQAVRRRVDPSVERTALGQSAGDWTGDVLPERPRIWVAGCGTNQAVLTALRFPGAHVVGSDVSPESVAASAQLAERLGVTNLDLQVESINDVTYDREFDHVISTGVVHHNADPAATLARVAAALAPDGLLELMVYNRYHCTEAIAVQKAVRLLAPATGEAGADFDAAMTAARHILDARPDLVARMKPGFSGVAHFEAAAADALIQPVMHTFTVAELDAMAGGCGLELALPCVNQFDVGRQCVDWNLRFADTALQRRYLSLTDVERWQVLPEAGRCAAETRRSGGARPVRRTALRCGEPRLRGAGPTDGRLVPRLRPERALPGATAGRTRAGGVGRVHRTRSGPAARRPDRPRSADRPADPQRTASPPDHHRLSFPATGSGCGRRLMWLRRKENR
jgi:SAM-dependent methyltransferase